MNFPDLGLEPEIPKLEKHGRAIKEKRLFHKDSTLHVEQLDALSKLVDWFSHPEKKDYTAVVVMPTGTGKTGVICCLPYMLGWAVNTDKIPRRELDLYKPILIIAPGLVIFNQLERSLCYGANYQDNEPFLLKIGLLHTENIQDGHYYRTYCVKNTQSVKHLAKEVGRHEIFLSNSQKWRKDKEGTPNYEDLDEKMFSVVVVDEAHHLPAKQWEKIMQKFKPHAKVIFFTATPDRFDGKEITTDGAISKYGYAYYLGRDDAIQRRLIRKVNIHIESAYEKQVQRETEAERKTRVDNDCKMLVLKAVEAILRKKNADLPLPGEKQHAALIITRDISDADNVKKICTENLEMDEKKVKVVTSKITTTKDRNAAIQSIKDGDYKIVIIVKMLLEGFDYPPFSVAGIVTRIVSPVKFAQFVGRIQRLVRPPTVHAIEDKRIEGDLVTHVHYKQEELFQSYINPVVPADENQLLDVEGEIDEDDQN